MNVYRIKTSDVEKARALGFVLYLEGDLDRESSRGESRRETTLNKSAMQTPPVP